MGEHSSENEDGLLPLVIRICIGILSNMLISLQKVGLYSGSIRLGPRSRESSFAGLLICLYVRLHGPRFPKDNAKPRSCWWYLDGYDDDGFSMMITMMMMMITMMMTICFMTMMMIPVGLCKAMKRHQLQGWRPQLPGELSWSVVTVALGMKMFYKQWRPLLNGMITVFWHCTQIITILLVIEWWIGLMSTKARESKVALSIFLFQGATSAESALLILLLLLTAQWSQRGFAHRLYISPSTVSVRESLMRKASKRSIQDCVLSFLNSSESCFSILGVPINFGLPNCREVPSFTAFSSPMFPLTKHVWGLCWSYIPPLYPSLWSYPFPFLAKVIHQVYRESDTHCFTAMSTR